MVKRVLTRQPAVLLLNGYGEHSPGGYSMLSALVVELVLSAGFPVGDPRQLDKFAPAGFAPIAIGPGLNPDSLN